LQAPALNLSDPATLNRFDVVVVGSGAAGLYAALCLPAHLQVCLITKDQVSLSASDWAQGGIAAAMDPQDSPMLHVEDTLRAGAGLCDRAAVEFLATQAPSCIENLQALGVAFDRHGSSLSLTLEAAHSRRRVLHAADTTGRAVVSILAERVLERDNIVVLSQAFVLDLWLDPTRSRCQGIVLFYGGAIHWLPAGAVILSTGGGGQVYAQTTNPAISTGDGVAIAWRAGALLRDLEFMQFHPTSLTKPGAPHFLISEAVRGEGAHLIDHQGHRFAFDYDPAGELAPRDVVSRAIFRHLQRTAADPATATVWLDLQAIPEETICRRFPNILQVCRQWGVDPLREPIPVAPAAHYWMGGVVTDLASRSSIPGLYAVGETASTGVHGANRLASNSLLECLVFGTQLAQLEAVPKQAIAPELPTVLDPAAWDDWQAQSDQIQEVREKLPRLMWDRAGICREAEALAEAIAQVEHWQRAIAKLPITQAIQHLSPAQTVKVSFPEAGPSLRVWGETINLLTIGCLILKSAHFRTESRGGHFRLDYPTPQESWQAHTLVQGNQWQKSAIASAP